MEKTAEFKNIFDRRKPFVLPIFTVMEIADLNKKNNFRAIRTIGCFKVTDISLKTR